MHCHSIFTFFESMATASTYYLLRSLVSSALTDIFFLTNIRASLTQVLSNIYEKTIPPLRDFYNLNTHEKLKHKGLN